MSANLRVGGRSFGACSVAVMRGFNSGAPVGPKGLKGWAFSVGKAFGSMVATNVGGYGDAGVELLIGMEANSFNPNQPDHHHWDRHGGHILRRAVRLLGAGEVHLSGWSGGKGGSGSQMRTVTWIVPNREEMAKIAKGWKEKAARPEPRAPWDLYVTACGGYDAGLQEGDW